MRSAHTKTAFYLLWAAFEMPVQRIQYVYFALPPCLTVLEGKHPPRFRYLGALCTASRAQPIKHAYVLKDTAPRLSRARAPHHPRASR